MDESRTLGVGLVIHLRLAHFERENLRLVLMVRVAASIAYLFAPDRVSVDG
jgi:hypothetical protein